MLPQSTAWCARGSYFVYCLRCLSHRKALGFAARRFKDVPPTASSLRRSPKKTFAAFWSSSLEFSLIKQYQALLSAEKVDLSFSDESIQEIARLAADINQSVENIGARRLQTVLEKLLEEISFTASDKAGEKIEISADLVRSTVGVLAQDRDITKFIL